MLTPNGIEVQSILLGRESVEIAVMEPRDQELAERTGILKIRSIAVPAELIGEVLVELLEAVDAVVDRVAVIERQPVDSFTRRR